VTVHRITAAGDGTIFVNIQNIDFADVIAYKELADEPTEKINKNCFHSNYIQQLFMATMIFYYS
jgi:hypothetical protein